MSTRSLASRLKRLETRFGPSPESPRMMISFVNSKGEVSVKLRWEAGRQEYLSPGGRSLTDEKVARLRESYDECVSR